MIRRRRASADDRASSAAHPARPGTVHAMTVARHAGSRRAASAINASTLTVASVPANHVYVRHLAHPGVHRIADPSGDDRRTPQFLDPSWWRNREARGQGIDVLHVNFGSEYYAPEQLAEVCLAAHEAGTAVVYTCHDLRNPNHTDPSLHDQALSRWMEGADQIVTLTPWAADQIAARFGRDATVIAHPHVVPLDELARRQAAPPRRHDGYRFAIHFKSLRANIIAAPLLRAALDGLTAIPEARLVVHAHHDVFDRARPAFDPTLVHELLEAVGHADSRVELHVHHYLSDVQLWDLIEGVDAFILPYAFGTHSGLLEAAKDLGTAVLAPHGGGYGDQGAHVRFAADEHHGLDAESFVAAMARAVQNGPVPAASVRARQHERDAVADRYLKMFAACAARYQGVG